MNSINVVKENKLLTIELISRIVAFLLLQGKLISIVTNDNNWLPNYVNLVFFELTAELLENIIVLFFATISILILFYLSKKIVFFSFFSFLFFLFFQFFCDYSFLFLLKNFSEFSIMFLLLYLVMIKKRKRKKLFQ